MRKIIAISGPSQVGKDTAAGIILDELMTRIDSNSLFLLRMSLPLKQLATELLLEKKYASESLKDHPMNDLETTFRKVQIELYHLGAKLFGEDWLGHHFIRNVHLLPPSSTILIPDAGRACEIQVLLDYELPLTHINLQREGTTFEGDCREAFVVTKGRAYEATSDYNPELSADGAFPTDSHIIKNNSTIADLRSRLAPIIDEITAQRS